MFQDYDVVLAPVMPTTAFPHDTDRPITDRVLDVDGTAVPHLIAMAWCGAIGSVLLPVVTLPSGRTPAGLPVGVQVIGPFLSTCACSRSPNSSRPPLALVSPRRPSDHNLRRRVAESVPGTPAGPPRIELGGNHALVMHAGSLVGGEPDDRRAHDVG